MDVSHFVEAGATNSDDRVLSCNKRGEVIITEVIITDRHNLNREVQI